MEKQRMSDCKGRHVGLKFNPPEFVCKAKEDEIRVDDVRNSEFWLEIQLTPERRYDLVRFAAKQYVDKVKVPTTSIKLSELLDYLKKEVDKVKRDEWLAKKNAEIAKEKVNEK
jgi:hypothetical protein